MSVVEVEVAGGLGADVADVVGVDVQAVAVQAGADFLFGGVVFVGRGHGDVDRDGQLDAVFLLQLVDVELAQGRVGAVQADVLCGDGLRGAPAHVVAEVVPGVVGRGVVGQGAGVRGSRCGQRLVQQLPGGGRGGHGRCRCAAVDEGGGDGAQSVAVRRFTAVRAGRGEQVVYGLDAQLPQRRCVGTGVVGCGSVGGGLGC